MVVGHGAVRRKRAVRLRRKINEYEESEWSVNGLCSWHITNQVMQRPIEGKYTQVVSRWCTTHAECEVEGSWRVVQVD